MPLVVLQLLIVIFIYVSNNAPRFSWREQGHDALDLDQVRLVVLQLLVSILISILRF